MLFFLQSALFDSKSAKPVNLRLAAGEIHTRLRVIGFGGAQAHPHPAPPPHQAAVLSVPRSTLVPSSSSLASLSCFLVVGGESESADFESLHVSWCSGEVP